MVAEHAFHKYVTDLVFLSVVLYRRNFYNSFQCTETNSCFLGDLKFVHLVIGFRVLSFVFFDDIWGIFESFWKYRSIENGTVR